MPLFPTLKKLPKDVNNKYTEETHHKNEEPKDYQKTKTSTIKPETSHNIPKQEKKEEKKEEKEKKSKNPMFFWKNKKNKVNDDSKILDKKNNLEINKEIGRAHV